MLVLIKFMKLIESKNLDKEIKRKYSFDFDLYDKLYH